MDDCLFDFPVSETFFRYEDEAKFLVFGKNYQLQRHRVDAVPVQQQQIIVKFYPQAIPQAPQRTGTGLRRAKG